MTDWVAEFNNRHDQFVKDGGAMALSSGDVVWDILVLGCKEPTRK
jgi:hypothetical protein